MNHLAHFHLTGGSEPLVVGALLGDCIKGPLDGRLSQPLELGVRLHRRVDAFMDGHPLLRQLRSLFPGRERRLAGIVLDMYFDHLLVRHWRRFHERELAHFSSSIYAILRPNDTTVVAHWLGIGRGAVHAAMQPQRLFVDQAAGGGGAVGGIGYGIHGLQS